MHVILAYMTEIARALRLPKATLFLWGPRQTGKTTLLKTQFPDAHRIDLLRTDEQMRYQVEPHRLREECRALPPERIVVIDEIQKVPQLLDEVHYLMQEERRTFVLCGSSARKVRRSHANLLGGRALRFELLGLSARELGGHFSLERMLNHGPLPPHYLAESPRALQRAYVDTYLKEEILEEGLTRNLPSFADFLRAAAIGDTEVTNFSNVARECGVASSTVRDHYDILVDTLIGAFIPAYTKRAKRRVTQAPKFYFRDVGVVNYLARRGRLEAGGEIFGKAFENWVFHELSVHARYTEAWYPITYWRLSSGIEVDFVLGDGEVAIEVKSSSRVHTRATRHLLEFRKEHPGVKELILVCGEDKPRRTEEGVWILPYAVFLERLWSGELPVPQG
ncbi:MAG: ATP-binding protein [Opitutales bacterium]|nr:ATP-binding protein [Opitutales bacterium]